MSVSLWLCFIIFAAILAIAFWLILIDSVQNQYKNRELGKMEQAALTLAGKYGQKDFFSSLPVIAGSDDYFVMWVSEKDYEIYGYYNNEGQEASFEDGPEGIAGEALFEKLNHSNGYLFFYVDDKPHNSQWAVWAVVLANIDGNREALVVSKSMADVDQLLRVLLSRSVIVITAVMVIAAVIAVFLANFYVQPIERLNFKALEMASGNLEVEFPKGGPLEIVQLSESLTKARDEFQATEALRRDFVANISHDMKTPLTVIKAYAEMLESYSGEIPEKREEHLKIIMNETDKLTALINDTMELARLQSGTIALKMEQFSLFDVAREAMDGFKIRPDLESFTFVAEGEEKAVVYGDRQLIYRVFYNLVNNGIKFCSEDKYVAIRIGREDGMVYATVTDHGIGIEKEKLHLIWERFYQVLPYSKDKAGMGMGLNIVLQILKLHQARYGVDSTPGKGTTIWFALKENDYETQDH